MQSTTSSRLARILLVLLVFTAGVLVGLAQPPLFARADSGSQGRAVIGFVSFRQIGNSGYTLPRACGDVTIQTASRQTSQGSESGVVVLCE